MKKRMVLKGYKGIDRMNRHERTQYRKSAITKKEPVLLIETGS
jgi:hypothetical protein